MPTTPANALAANFKRLRTEHGYTLDYVVTMLGQRGIHTTTGRLSDIERGRASATMDTVGLLLTALNTIQQNRDYGLWDLLSTDEHVKLDKTLTVSPLTWKAMLTSESSSTADYIIYTPKYPNGLSTPHDLARVAEFFGAPPVAQELEDEANGREPALVLADRRAIKKLDVSESSYIDLCIRKWGHLLSAESRLRAPSGASPQKIGRITRELLTELSRDLESAADAES